jgi:hypothetical protein
MCRRLWSFRKSRDVKLDEITGLKLGEETGLVQTSPIACNTETQLLELRLDRGI